MDPKVFYWIAIFMRPTKFETAWNVHFNSKTFSHTFYLTKICPKNGKYFDTKIPSIAATFLLVGEILGNFPGINFAQKKIYFSLVTAGFNCAHKSSVGCHRIRANISWNSNPEKFIFMQICPISHWLLLRQWLELLYFHHWKHFNKTNSNLFSFSLKRHIYDRIETYYLGP